MTRKGGFAASKRIIGPTKIGRRQDTALPQEAKQTAEDREIALCEERLQTLLPEVERARAAVTTAEETKRATTEAHDRKQARLELEQSNSGIAMRRSEC